jgi:AraC-like DNA-binding protein
LFSSSNDELPLQLYQLGAKEFQFHRAQPSAQLQSYIYYYWWLDVASGDTSIEVIPDNAIDLVMSPDIPGFSVLYLPELEKFSIPLSGPITYVGISFRAESAADFFKLSHAELSACVPSVDATESLSLSSLVAGVQRMTSAEELTSTLDTLATQYLNRPNEHSTPTVKLDIPKALAAMQASVGSRGMESMAARFELSDRQFRRIMSSLFGYGPKKIQRVMRLQSSLKEMLTSDTLLLEDGFYDEAHKIKEIRALTGLTPGEIRKVAEIYNSMI